jgi:DnaJ-class molecular chaperone
MKCPKCNGLNIATEARSAPVSRPIGHWRHSHGLCCDCGQKLWWTAQSGDAGAILKEGPHDCAFFRTASEPA